MYQRNTIDEAGEHRDVTKTRSHSSTVTLEGALLLQFDVLRSQMICKTIHDGYF